MFLKDLDDRINRAVAEKRFTQKKLAEQAGIDPAQLSRFLKLGAGISTAQLQTLERTLAELTADPEPIPLALAIEMARKLRDNRLDQTLPRRKARSTRRHR